jgi:hypothetical protein
MHDLPVDPVVASTPSATSKNAAGTGKNAASVARGRRIGERQHVGSGERDDLHRRGGSHDGAQLRVVDLTNVNLVIEAEAVLRDAVPMPAQHLRLEVHWPQNLSTERLLASAPIGAPVLVLSEWIAHARQEAAQFEQAGVDPGYVADNLLEAQSRAGWRWKTPKASRSGRPSTAEISRRSSNHATERFASPIW